MILDINVITKMPIEEFSDSAKKLTKGELHSLDNLLKMKFCEAENVKNCINDKINKGELTVEESQKVSSNLYTLLQIIEDRSKIIVEIINTQCLTSEK